MILQYSITLLPACELAWTKTYIISCINNSISHVDSLSFLHSAADLKNGF